MKKRQVPELSLKAYLDGSESEKNNFSDQLFCGLKDYGFIILKDHDAKTSLLDEAYNKLEALCSLPIEKKKYICHEGAGQRAYTPFGEEHAKDAEVHDLKEFWHIGREIDRNHPYKKYYPDNIWLNEEDAPNFKAIFLAFIKILIK